MTVSVNSSAPEIVRVMTWNIHGGVGSDGRYDLQRVVNLVRSHQPQVIALQEIDTRRGAPSEPDAFTYLAEELGGNAHASRLMRAPDGDYGHTLISCWPMSRARFHDISYGKREPRAAIETVVHAPHGPLHVLAAHLGLSLKERHQQALKLAQIVQRSGDRTVLMGDLNDWVGRGSVQRILNGLFPGHSHLKTFPAFWPLLPLDRIYCQPGSMLCRCWTDRTAKLASDHLPLIADLDLDHRPLVQCQSNSG